MDGESKCKCENAVAACHYAVVDYNGIDALFERMKETALLRQTHNYNSCQIK